jgi:hypothetical protein
MNPDAERPLTPSQKERQVKYDKLLLTIIDRRYQIEEQLEQTATSIHHSYSGFYSEAYEPPEFLDSFIMPFESVTLEVEADTDESGTTHISTINLYPVDSAPITLSLSDQIGTLTCGDELRLVSPDNVRDVLRQVAPHSVRAEATNEQLLAYVAALSPELSKTIERKVVDDDNCQVIRFTKIETVDDSIESLEVITLTPHATGAHIGTHMLFTEALSRRSQAVDSNAVNHRLTIDALHLGGDSQALLDEQRFDLDDWSIEVTSPVQRHLRDIVATLKTLR